MAKYNRPEDIPFFKEYSKGLYPSLLDYKYSIEDDFEDNENYACLIEQVLCLGIPGYEGDQTRFLVTEEAVWPEDIKVYQQEAIEFAKENTALVKADANGVRPGTLLFVGNKAKVEPTTVKEPYPSATLTTMWFDGTRERYNGVYAMVDIGDNSDGLPDQWCMVEQILGDELYGGVDESSYPYKLLPRSEVIKNPIDPVEVETFNAPYPSAARLALLKQCYFVKKDVPPLARVIEFPLVANDKDDAWAIIEQIVADSWFGKDTQELPTVEDVGSLVRLAQEDIALAKRVNKPHWFYR